MVKIIQDFKDWKKTKKIAADAEYKMNQKFDEMLGRVSVDEYFRNVAREALFYENLPMAKDQDNPTKDEIRTFDSYVVQASKICRANSCFYMLYDPFSKTDGKRYNEKSKEIHRCINNHKVGVIFEKYCDGCSAFKDLVEYRSLKAQNAQAQRNYGLAKEILLDNFRFRKK